MTNKQLQEIREKLLAERARVVESLQRTSQHTLSEMDDTTRDSGDLASASHDRGLLYSLQELGARRLQKIDQMLSLIDRKGYGTCQQCEEPIGAARLDAIPWATLCVQCQEQADSSDETAFASPGGGTSDGGVDHGAA